MNTAGHSFSGSFRLTNSVDSKVLCEDLSREESRETMHRMGQFSIKLCDFFV